MTVQPILRWPHSLLRTRAEEVGAVDEGTIAIWTDMIETMDAMPGVGLAAPQIGIGLRLCVVDASDERGQAVRMANPVIVSHSDEMRNEKEASPCLPGAFATISRSAGVSVAYLDVDGVQQEREFEGLWATSVQHQIDHLNGRMYFDNLSRVKREMLLKRARKVAR